MKVSRTKILNQLVKMVCLKEKGKKQLNAGQAREVIKVIAKLCAEDGLFEEIFYHYTLEFPSTKAKKKK